MTALNGQTVGAPPDPPNPKLDVARAVFATLADDGETWDDLSEGEQAEFLNIADHYLSAHSAWLISHGFRVIPPGAAMRPKTEAEAMGMLQAAKEFLTAAKRKPGLLTTGPRLIVPKTGLN